MSQTSEQEDRPGDRPEEQSFTDKQRKNRERRLANLKPFKPGQSGNPKGRPKRRAISEAYRKLLEHVNDEGETIALKLAQQVIADALDGDLAAIREVTDRTEGKPKQEQEIKGSIGVTAKVTIYLPDNGRNDASPSSEPDPDDDADDDDDS